MLYSDVGGCRVKWVAIVTTGFSSIWVSMDDISVSVSEWMVFSLYLMESLISPDHCFGDRLLLSSWPWISSFLGTESKLLIYDMWEVKVDIWGLEVPVVPTYRQRKKSLTAIFEQVHPSCNQGISIPSVAFSSQQTLTEKIVTYWGPVLCELSSVCVLVEGFWGCPMLFSVLSWYVLVFSLETCP